MRPCHCFAENPVMTPTSPRVEATTLTLTSRAQHDLAPFYLSPYLSCTLTIKLLCLHHEGPFIDPGAHQSGSYPSCRALVPVIISPRNAFPSDIHRHNAPIFFKYLLKCHLFIEAYKPPKNSIVLEFIDAFC